MQAYTFTFIANATGSPDEIQLPQDFPSGKKRILIRPPAGHAWTYYGFNRSTGYPLDTDREFEVLRQTGEAPFSALDIIGAAALDTGSGTFSAIAP